MQWSKTRLRENIMSETQSTVWDAYRLFELSVDELAERIGFPDDICAGTDIWKMIIEEGRRLD